MPLEYLLFALCHGDPAGLELMANSFTCSSRLHMGWMLGWGQLIAPVLGLGCCRVGQSASSPPSSLVKRAVQHYPGQFPLCSKEQGVALFLCFHALRNSSTVFPTRLKWCYGWLWAGPALPLATVQVRGGQRKASHPHPCHPMGDEGQGRIPQNYLLRVSLPVPMLRG